MVKHRHRSHPQATHLSESDGSDVSESERVQIPSTPQKLGQIHWQQNVEHPHSLIQTGPQLHQTWSLMSSIGSTSNQGPSHDSQEHQLGSSNIQPGKQLGRSFSYHAVDERQAKRSRTGSYLPNQEQGPWFQQLDCEYWDSTLLGNDISYSYTK